MKQKERLKEAIDFIKKSKSLTNEGISISLGYRAKNYVSDIVSGSKTVNNFLLKKLEDKYSIRSEWVKTGKGEMVYDSREIDTADSEFDPSEIYAKKDPLNRLKTLEEWAMVAEHMRDELAFNRAKATGRRLQECLDEVNTEILELLQTKLAD